MKQLYFCSLPNRLPASAALALLVSNSRRPWLTGSTTALSRLFYSWLLLAVLLVVALPQRAFADSGLYKDFVILQAGSSSVNTYYYTNLATANYGYQGANLGSFTRAAGGRLLLEGGEVNTYQHNGVYMQSAQLLYRVYPSGTVPGPFNPLELPYLRSGQDGDAGNKEWTQTTASIDLLAIAARPGSYVLEVYFQALGSYGGQVFTNYDGRYGANYQATFTVTGTLPLADPSDDLTRNWSYSRTYDLDGNVTSEGKQFVDAMGRPTQAQSKNLAEQQVFATQSLNNQGGIPVLTTLPAPTNNQAFKYKDGFVTATTTPAGGGTPVSANYSAANFEKPTGSAPDPLDETTPGTLGYYYSQNNTLEPAIAATHNPYSLSEPMPGPLGGMRRAARPGDAFALGSGHEARGRDFPLLNELDYYSRLRALFLPTSPTPSLRAQGVKIVAINSNGLEAISFRNREGQPVASCLTGDQYPASTLTGTLASDPTNTAGKPTYQDIHIAASASTTALTVTDGTTSGSPSSYVLINLQQNPLVETAYSGSQALNLSPGFYRLLVTSGQVSFSYQVHYGEFSYVFYDDASRAVASIAPKGVAELLPNGLDNPVYPTVSPVFTALYRIHAQTTGATLSTSRGTFADDQYYSPNPGSANSTTDAIAGTPDPALYQRERVGVTGLMSYAFPVPAGTYTVVLHFAETFFTSAGQRVFDVSLENSPVLVGYDITKKVGPRTATMETFTVNVTDGVLNIDFSSQNPGGVNLPKISAIEVLTPSQPAAGVAGAIHFVTTKVFDTAGRALSATSPDEGTTRYVYARDGRIRFTQSAVQAQPAGGAPRRFSYSNYDSAGRIIESGEYTESTTPGQGFVFEDMLTASPVANSVMQAALLEERVTNDNSTGSLAANQCAQRQQVWYDLPQPDAALGSRQQDFMLGAVAKTSNGTSTTWYSYDDRGQLTWLVQQVPGVGVKTVDYTYDAAGNITQVAYQQGQQDSFYHYYSYDANQHLTQVLTSPDGVTRSLQARYFYYLHGPLKRMETAGNLQGTDYIYTVQGWLKGINSANRHFDGDNPKSNGLAKDLFGLTLDYFGGDYRSAQTSMATPTIANAPTTRFDGTVRSAAWFTAASPLMRQHVFTYDAKGQLQQADFGELVPGATPTAAGSFVVSSTHAYEEGNLSYDLNGNIRTLRRRDGTGVATDDFTYQYPTGSNQLSAVNNPGGSAVLDYDYDANGQMTRQRDEKGQRYLTYDVMGKVTGVYRNAAHSQPLVVFTYDDRGFRASKASYDPATYQLKKTTYSVRDIGGNELATYTLDATTPGSGIQQSELPLYGAGRLGTLTRLDNGSLDYRYELNDQLGNARLIYHRPTTTTYTATMEASAASQEEQNFTNVASTRYYDPGHNGSATVSLLGMNSGQRIGPSKTLTVQKGDTVTFTAYAWLTAAISQPGGPHHTNVVRMASLAGATMLAGPTTPTTFVGPRTEAASPIKSLSWLPRLSVGIGIPLVTRQIATASPATPQAITGSSGSAYIHFIVRDENGNSIRDDYQEANGSSPGSWQQLQVGLRLAQGGTVEMRVETDGAGGPDVYFDDVQIDYTSSTIVQEQHNYAYGAPMQGLNYVVGSTRYRHGYQGQFAEKDEETGTDDFELRNYDSRIGRWTAPDPMGQFSSPYVGMGNNPIDIIDPSGGWGFSTGFTNFLAAVGIGSVNAAGKYSIDFALTLSASTGASLAQAGMGAANSAVRVAGQGPIKPNSKPNSHDYTISTSPLVIPMPGGFAIPKGILGGLTWEEVIGLGATYSPLIFLTIPGDHAIPSDRQPEATLTLYRGVEPDQPEYPAALRGMAIPWSARNSGAHSDEYRHNGGDWKSIFTSWSEDIKIANGFAQGMKGMKGVILKKTFLRSQVVKSPDTFDEKEWLVPGIVTGAQVLPMLAH